MTLTEAAKKISDGITELAPSHYEYKLLKEINSAYIALTGSSAEPGWESKVSAKEERLELCKKILKWYDSAYHADTAKGKRKPPKPDPPNEAETARNTPKTQSGNSAGAGNLSRLRADLDAGQKDQ